MDSVIFKKIFLCILLCVCSSVVFRYCVCVCVYVSVCFHLVLLQKSFYKVPNRRAVNQRVTTDFSRPKCTCASIPLVHNGRNPSRAVFHFRTKPRIFLPPKTIYFSSPNHPQHRQTDNNSLEKALLYVFICNSFLLSLPLFFPPISLFFPHFLPFSKCIYLSSILSIHIQYNLR